MRELFFKAVFACFEAARVAAVRLGQPYRVNFFCRPFARLARAPAVHPVSEPAVDWRNSRLLVVGEQKFGCTGRARREAFRALVKQVEEVDLSSYIHGLTLIRQIQTNHLFFGEQIRRINRAVLEKARAVRPDLVWVEKGLYLWPQTLIALREIGCRRLIHFSPDNQRVFSNQSRHYARNLSLYDVHVTTKKDDVDWLLDLGAPRVERMGEGFDPELHRPFELNPQERRRFECQISFVGHWEPWREQLLLRLSNRGYAVKVWGGDWRRACFRRHPLFSDACQLDGPDYAKAIGGAKISLCLLSRWFGDRTTTRSVEIPACGSLLLAERTPEHLEMFEEGREAEFYGTEQEMLEKIDKYLGDEKTRQAVAKAGQARCLSRYSNEARLRDVLELIFRGKKT